MDDLNKDKVTKYKRHPKKAGEYSNWNIMSIAVQDEYSSLQCVENNNNNLRNINRD